MQGIFWITFHHKDQNCVHCHFICDYICGDVIVLNKWCKMSEQNLMHFRIRIVAKKQWLRQYDLEKAEDLLSSKNSQREALDAQKVFYIRE